MKIYKKGFTLIEVIVALSILGIAITVVLQLFSANLRALSQSEDYVLALIAADMKMREITQSDDLEEKVWSETSQQGYRFDISITETLKERTETLQSQLFDIQLTISWRSGTKEKTYTIKTLKSIARKVK